MESGSESSAEEAAVAMGLVIDTETDYVTLQLLTVGDDRPVPDIETTEEEIALEAGSTHSDVLERILTEELPQSDASESTAWGSAVEDGNQMTRELLTPFEPPPLAEGEHLVKEALDLFEHDRLRHCALVERLTEVLKQLRGEKRLLLSLLYSASSDRAELRYKQQEQLLERFICGKRVLETLRKLKEDEMPLTDLQAQSDSDLRRRQRLGHTQRPVPDWMTENVAPQEWIGEEGEIEKSHPLKDMAMKIQTCPRDSTGRRGYCISWVTLEEVDEGEIPVEQLEASAPMRAPPVQDTRQPSSSVVTEVAEPEERATEKEAVEVLLDLAAMGLGTPQQGVKTEASPQEPIQTPPMQPTPREPKPVTPPAEPVPVTTIRQPPSEVKPAPAEPQISVNQAKPPEVQHPVEPQVMAPAPVQPQQPSVFPAAQMPDVVSPAPVQASLIAGGAAFGQPSVPQSAFSMSSVAPQLGSLGQSSTGGVSQGSFAGITGGFGAFVKQSAEQGTNPLASNSAAQSSQFSAFRGTPLPGLGTGSTSSGLFGSKPSTTNDKLWEMRK